LTVTLVIDVQGLKDKSIFDKHLSKEGFTLIKDEDFAYKGTAHTHLFNTRAYIMDVIHINTITIMELLLLINSHK